MFARLAELPNQLTVTRPHPRRQDIVRGTLSIFPDFVEDAQDISPVPCSSNYSTPPPPKIQPDLCESWKDVHGLIAFFELYQFGLGFAIRRWAVVAIALPTIVEELGGGEDYSWVGSAYLLASCTLAPLYGKTSDLVGRKPVLYCSILIFLLGSALCGASAAKSFTWLVISRAVQGVGGGGISQLVLITVSDIVSLQDRGKYGGLFIATGSFASVVGNLIGGVLVDHLSWRWCFWINLPIGGFPGVVLFFFLNLNPHQGMSLQQHLSQFDFLGLTLFMSGIVCALIGLSSGQTNWSSAETITLLCVGCTLLILATVNEIFTTRSPIVPPRLFKTRTMGILLITGFLQSVTTFASNFYLPLYFQVLGSSATGAAVWMIPFSAGFSAIPAGAGLCCYSHGNISWPFFSTAEPVDLLGQRAEKVLYPLITASGIGCFFQSPLIALQAAMPLKDMATTTGVFEFLRTIGSTIGISVGQVIYSSVLKRKINRIPNLSGIKTSPAALAESVRTLQHLPQPERGQIIHAYAQSISAIWVFNTPVAAVGFIMVLFIKAYSLKRNTFRGGVHAKPDEEKAASGTTTSVGADTTDEKSGGFDQSFQVGGAEGQELIAIDIIGSTK
ncbi:Major facilitator superfamily domain containing protein [Lactarius tabidus]